MASKTNRQAARARLLNVFMAELDRFIPTNEEQPLRGERFVEWEDQVMEMVRTIGQVGLEERSKLDRNAAVEDGGHCPFCGSDKIYLQSESKQRETHSRHGPVVMETQDARCRACNRSFSPSKKKLGPSR